MEQTSHPGTCKKGSHNYAVKPVLAGQTGRDGCSGDQRNYSIGWTHKVQSTQRDPGSLNGWMPDTTGGIHTSLFRISVIGLWAYGVGLPAMFYLCILRQTVNVLKTSVSSAVK